MSADPNTELADERTRLALERTLMGWIPHERLARDVRVCARRGVSLAGADSARHLRLGLTSYSVAMIACSRSRPA